MAGCDRDYAVQFDQFGGIGQHARGHHVGQVVEVAGDRLQVAHHRRLALVFRAGVGLPLREISHGRGRLAFHQREGGLYH